MGARPSAGRAFAGLAWVWMVAACSPTPAGPPSVVLVTLDTTRADYVTHLGGPAGATPEIDAWAARSAVFTRAHSETNVTNPSHLSIMTGLRAIEHGVIDNQTRIPFDVDTLPDAFRRAGYATAAFVSARHLGPEFGWTGFQTMPPSTGPIRAERTTNLAIRWLDTIGDRPYFLWVHYYDPHGPYDPPLEFGLRWSPEDPGIGDPPPGWNSRSLVAVRRWQLNEWKRKADADEAWARAMYTAEIAYTDSQVGRLLSAVQARPAEPIVVVTADHGESLGEHGIRWSHGGAYEVSLRIPLLFHVPGLAPLVSDAAVSSLDVAPTLAELTGIELRQATSGRSLVPILRGAAHGVPDPPFFVYQESHNRGVAVRQGSWKLLWTIKSVAPLPDEPQLFDLAHDPDEQVNLADEQPERVQELRREIEPWVALGLVRGGDTTHLDRDALEELRALGYVEP